jgi:hypothetical protein
MAKDINQRLQQLRARRGGTDRLTAMDEAYRADALVKSSAIEGWQERATNKPFTQYALGAMAAVDPDYTRVSLETAERVGNQLKTQLTNAGLSVEFRLQGSVPLDVHIRGVSDVDLLTLDTNFLVYARSGARAKQGGYTPTSDNSVTVLTRLRTKAGEVLKEKFPKATVDTSGGKAIKIFGGSLARPVDVVPSHWYDSVEYQQSQEETQRGVKILDSKKGQVIDNYPFLHIKIIHERDAQYLGGLKKAIRLCKNVKAEAAEDGKTIELSSFDIASTMYHAQANPLIFSSVYELQVLTEAQRHFDALARNIEVAKQLMVPDNSRKIFDTQEKLQGLIQLSIELDALFEQVVGEHDPILAKSALHDSARSRATLEGVQLPSS